ncbi:hypothetical protein PYCCODRAFT_1371806 [Trametes coccinea BRFM310]|uniref:BTB domain-containing protein n=1 Tax=Trametes coccinea (strain BRFM310) TaxID=1353009 RepID=A0A1Y2IG67_TRAC3|nr:hypothetical protein PYCCODRAFT_1371806 [Trametes coccinea BRFM310]
MSASLALACPTTPQLKDYNTTDFWFMDGNMILFAGAVAFKVHRGQLVRHSDVFHDMFSLPQPEEGGQGLVDGCPWVELYDDPSDVLHLLRALYDGLYFTKPTSGDFCAISAVLRMSTKYLIEHLRQRCIERLEADWPTTLAGWDKREQQATFDGRYNPRELYAHPIMVIQLAQELNLEHLLPAAFYDLSRYGPRKIAHGASLMPGLLPSTVAQIKARARANNRTDDPLRLTRHDLRATFLGREASQQFLSTFIDGELSGRAISANCANRHHANGHHCRESFYFVMLNVLRSVSGIASGRDADPLFSVLQAVEMLSRTDFSDGTKQCGLRICASCKEDFTLSAAKAREEAWAMIPVWFGLKDAPPDEGAKKMRKQ